MSATTITNYIVKIKQKKDESEQPKGPGAKVEYIIRNVLELSSIQDMCNDILAAKQPFAGVNKDDQLHLCPSSKGLLIITPDEDDYLYKAPYAQYKAKKAANDLKKKNGKLEPEERKEFGKFRSMIVVKWVDVNPYIRKIQKDAVEFFNAVSVHTLSKDFGRIERNEFDTYETSTITRQLRFLSTCMLSQGFKPPTIIYAHALEFQPPCVFRMGVPYQPSNLSSYASADPDVLIEKTSFKFLYNELELVYKDTPDDKCNYFMVTGLRYFNFSLKDKSSMLSAGSIQVSKRNQTGSLHESEPSTFKETEF
jgi:hypothetical protein